MLFKSKLDVVPSMSKSYILEDRTVFVKWEDSNPPIMSTVYQIHQYMYDVSKTFGNIIYATFTYSHQSILLKALIIYKEETIIDIRCEPLPVMSINDWIKSVHKDPNRVSLSLNYKFQRQTLNPMEHMVIKLLHNPKHFNSDELMGKLIDNMNSDRMIFDRKTGMFVKLINCLNSHMSEYNRIVDIPYSMKSNSYISQVCDGHSIVPRNVLDSLKFWFNRLVSDPYVSDTPDVNMTKSLFSSTLVCVIEGNPPNTLIPSIGTYSTYSYSSLIERDLIGAPMHYHLETIPNMISIFDDIEEDVTIDEYSLPLSIHYNKSTDIPEDLDEYIKYICNIDELPKVVNIINKLIRSHRLENVEQIIFHGDCDFIDAFVLTLLNCLKIHTLSMLDNCSKSSSYLSKMLQPSVDLIIMRDVILDNKYLTSTYVKRFLSEKRHIMCTTPRLPTVYPNANNLINKFVKRFTLVECIKCDMSPVDVKRYVEMNCIGIAKWFVRHE